MGAGLFGASYLSGCAKQGAVQPVIESVHGVA